MPEDTSSGTKSFLSIPVNGTQWYDTFFDRVDINLTLLNVYPLAPGSPGCCAIWHYSDVIKSTMASQITSGSIVYSTVCSDQRKKSKLRVTGLCEGNSPWPVISPHKGPVTGKMLPFDDVIMEHPFLLVFWESPLKLPSGEFRGTSQMIRYY